jgi:hypothetical protein
MVELFTVRAWHANPSVVDPGELVCPVYDTLTDEDFARFAPYRHNAVGFVPRPRKMTPEEFLAIAPAKLRDAIQELAYTQDGRPSYYVYGIRYVPPPDVLETLEPEARRPEYLLLGVVGTIDFDHLQHGQIALHERTFPDRVAERRALTEATGMCFAPILMGYHEADHRLNDRIERWLGLDRTRQSLESVKAPLVRVTLDGTTHLLWALDDPTEIAEVAAEVRRSRLLVLDGHHRFTAAAQRFYDGRPSAPLVMLVDGNDPALQLLPWHRVLSSGVAPFGNLLDCARQEFPVVQAVPDRPTAEVAIERLHGMHHAGIRGFLMLSPEGFVEVHGPRSEDVGADFDLLHVFLDDGMQIDPEALEFIRSPRLAIDRALQSDDSFPGGTAFLLPGLSAQGVEDRAFGRGQVMAQKSTMFLPKVAEGILFAPASASPR